MELAYRVSKCSYYVHLSMCPLRQTSTQKRERIKVWVFCLSPASHAVFFQPLPPHVLPSSCLLALLFKILYYFSHLTLQISLPSYLPSSHFKESLSFHEKGHFSTFRVFQSKNRGAFPSKGGVQTPASTTMSVSCFWGNSGIFCFPFFKREKCVRNIGAKVFLQKPT